MIAHAIFFYVFSLIAIISAIMVTVSKNTVHSVFFLILDFISISCLFIMIGAEFLGMIMLIVYVGAVAVLFLFVVMMLNVAQQKNQWLLSEDSSGHIPIGLIISTLIFAKINGKSFFYLSDLVSIVAPIGLFFGRIANFINTELIGRLTDFYISVIYPSIDTIPRHPSQIYEAFFEGIILFVILLIYFYKIKKYKSRWQRRMCWLRLIIVALCLISFIWTLSSYISIIK